MKTIQQMREHRNELANKARALLDENPEGSKWGKELQAQFDELTAEITQVDAQISREQKMLDLEAEKDFENLGGQEVDKKNLPPEAQRAIAIHEKWLRKGDKALNEEEWKILNTMSTGADAEGGYTVPIEVARSIIEPLKDYSGIRKVADVIQTDSGAKINFPTSDGTAEEGELVAENAAATDADPDFGVAPIDVYKFSSKVITVPIELLQDSATNIEAFVRNRIIARLGRITNRLFTTGTGAGQPFGAVARAAAGKVGAAGQVDSVIYDDIIDLVHSVDVGYRESGKCVFMMNDLTIAKIRKLKDSNGRPLWVPSDDAGIRLGQAGTLAGYPVIVNNHMPVMAASAKSILFGDFMKYTVRDVMAMSLFRFTDSAYTKKGQVGFLAWMRSGGNLLDTQAVKYYQNAAA